MNNIEYVVSKLAKNRDEMKWVGLKIGDSTYYDATNLTTEIIKSYNKEEVKKASIKYTGTLPIKLLSDCKTKLSDKNFYAICGIKNTNLVQYGFYFFDKEANILKQISFNEYFDELQRAPVAIKPKLTKKKRR